MAAPAVAPRRILVIEVIVAPLFSSTNDQVPSTFRRNIDWNFAVPTMERTAPLLSARRRKKQTIKLRTQKRDAAAASSLVARMAELRQSRVEIVGQQRHAEQI